MAWRAIRRVGPYIVTATEAVGFGVSRAKLSRSGRPDAVQCRDGARQFAFQRAQALHPLHERRHAHRRLSVEQFVAGTALPRHARRREIHAQMPDLRGGYHDGGAVAPVLEGYLQFVEALTNPARLGGIEPGVEQPERLARPRRDPSNKAKHGHGRYRQAGEFRRLQTR
jgi:hypothetical protein